MCVCVCAYMYVCMYVLCMYMCMYVCSILDDQTQVFFIQGSMYVCMWDGRRVSLWQ